MEWFAQNSGTIIVGLIVLAIVVAISVHLYRQKKEGKTQCGGCTGCSHSVNGHCDHHH